MKKICLRLTFLICTTVVLFSCEKDDNSDDYVALDIQTNPDTGAVLLNGTVDIAIFGNDTNIPEDGQITLSTPQSGTVELINNGTPNNLLDDVVRYTPGTNFTPTDTFQYTVCQSDGASCETETVTIAITEVSLVNVDLASVPYNNLSEYLFFEGAMADQAPAFGVLPYEPISSLFTDYAKKSRFVWLPDGTSATYNTDITSLDFPVGSVLIKTFYYDNVLPGNTTKIIETRLMIHKQDGWIFADYMWNEDQTEAVLDVAGDGGFVEVEWIQDGETKNVNYRIPATSQCSTCHRSNFTPVPIGVKPQNLNGEYNFGDGTMNQLQKWIDVGYLQDNLPSNITTVVDWRDDTQSLGLRVRSYMDINCGNCHVDGGHGDYRAVRLAFHDSDSDINMGICEDPDTTIPGQEGNKLITPGDALNSVIYYRMSTLNEQYRMPQFGRSLAHTESLELIEEWINSLTQTCD